MRTIEKWDKKRPINGISAEKVLDSNPSYLNAEIYLILNGDRVERIEDVAIIRSNYNLIGTDAEVMEKYLSSINESTPVSLEDMSTKDIVEALSRNVNNEVDNRILSGFVWKDMPIWLSTENQVNYKAAYDLAVQAESSNIEFTQIRFKFGTDDNVIYYKFKSLNELGDFYTSAFKHVRECLETGWSKKDSYENYTYEQLRNEYEKLLLNKTL